MSRFSRLSRWFHRMLERLLGRWNEGPDTPERYLEEVRLFRVFNPDATQDQWEHFCHDMIRRAYRDGWTRGYQWCERVWPGPAPEDVRLAEQHQHDWSLAKQDALWKAEMERVGEPRSARETVEARVRGFELRHNYRANRLKK